MIARHSGSFTLYRQTNLAEAMDEATALIHQFIGDADLHIRTRTTVSHLQAMGNDGPKLWDWDVEIDWEVMTGRRSMDTEGS